MSCLQVNNCLSGSGLKDLYKDMVNRYPILFIEDSFHDNDSKLFNEFPGKAVVYIMRRNNLLVSNHNN